MKQATRYGAKQRVAAIAFLACFLIVTVLAGAFVVTHADHEHDHSGVDGSCATCVQLQSAENILKQFSTALVGALFAIAGLFAVVATLKAVAFCVTLSTPITLKIRMNT